MSRLRDARASQASKASRCGAPVGPLELLVGMLIYFTYSYTRYGSDRTSHQAEPTNATKGYSTQSADRRNQSQYALDVFEQQGRAGGSKERKEHRRHAGKRGSVEGKGWV